MSSRGPGTQTHPISWLLSLDLDGTPAPPHTPTPPASHLPPGFNALVDVVRERAAGDEAAGPLGHMQVVVFQHDLALADDHQRGPTQLHPFKDVILGSLETRGRGKAMGMVQEAGRGPWCSLPGILPSTFTRTESPGKARKCIQCPCQLSAGTVPARATHASYERIS